MQHESPKRLKKYKQEPVGIHSEFSARGMFLFGLPFFAVGLWITLMASGVIAVDASKVNVPMPIFALVGCVFLFSGLIIWGTAWRQVRILKAIRRQMERYPSEPAMADYMWDRDGYQPPRWTPARKSCSIALFIAAFACVPNWLSYGDGDAPLFLRLMTILTNLIVITVFCYAAKKTWHAIKFGKTRLRYPHFPLRPGERIDLEIELPQGLKEPESAVLTLRCLREWYEVSGHGKNRSKRLVHDILYESKETLAADALKQFPGRIRTAVEVPIDAPGSGLQDQPPRFWELEMKLQVPGLDLEQSYLLPVYASIDA